MTVKGNIDSIGQNSKTIRRNEGRSWLRVDRHGSKATAEVLSASAI